MSQSAGSPPPSYPTSPMPVYGTATHRPPMGPGGPLAAPPTRAGHRRAGVAGILTLAVLAGGSAGLGGAALWDTVHPDPVAADHTPATTQQDSAPETAPVAASGSVESVARTMLPSVVQLQVSGAQGQGTGSGVILSSDGRILTNNHVVEMAGSGGSIRVDFNDGSHAVGKVVGTDPLTDVAVVQAQDVSGLTPARLGRSGSVQVGQEVVAVGSPYGLDATVTSGIVSALNRPVDVGSDGQGNVTAYPAIQTDAAINPGNSGGPLVDTAGRVVGINASIRGTTSSSGEAGSIGLGFAIPIDQVKPIVDQIVAGETPTHARLGVSLSTAPEQNTDGATVAEVTGGGAASDAGLRAGDVVTRIGSQPVRDGDGLIAVIRSYRPGDQVAVTYARQGTEHTAQVILGSDAQTANS